jgi:hypothetical protein
MYQASSKSAGSGPGARGRCEKAVGHGAEVGGESAERKSKESTARCGKLLPDGFNRWLWHAILWHGE